DHGNNLLVSAAFQVQLLPPPDLEVASVQAPTEAFSGQPLNLSWTVNNVGTGPTQTKNAGWFDEVLMSLNPTLDNSAIPLVEYEHAAELPAGDRYMSFQAVPLPVGLSGNFYFFVVADPEGRVFENGATGNNTGRTVSRILVHLTPPPDLEVTSITPPS